MANMKKGLQLMEVFRHNSEAGTIVFISGPKSYTSVL